MGTNWYWRHDACEHCGRSDDDMHVGKSSSGFQGHFRGGEPWIVSWQQWKDALRSSGSLWNEYGHREDVEEFISERESTDPSFRRRQYDWEVEHRRDVGAARVDEVVPRGSWLDADGWSFYGGDFS